MTPRPSPDPADPGGRARAGDAAVSGPVSEQTAQRARGAAVPGARRAGGAGQRAAVRGRARRKKAGAAKITAIATSTAVLVLVGVGAALYEHLNGASLAEVLTRYAR